MTRASSKPLPLSLPCAVGGGLGSGLGGGVAMPDALARMKYYSGGGVHSLRRPLHAAAGPHMAAHAMLVLPPPLVDGCPADKSSRSSTWTSYQGSAKTFSSELERGERIKPERSNRRNAVQKMQWRSSRWVTGFAAGEYLGQDADLDLDHRISSMTIADVSPRFAVKRILLLYENQQHREAANFINRLSHGTFKVEYTLNVYTVKKCYVKSTKFGSRYHPVTIRQMVKWRCTTQYGSYTPIFFTL